MQESLQGEFRCGELQGSDSQACVVGFGSMKVMGSNMPTFQPASRGWRDQVLLSRFKFCKMLTERGGGVDQHSQVGA